MRHIWVLYSTFGCDIGVGIPNRKVTTALDDVHVATAAAGNKVEILVTGNLGHFDSQELLAHGLTLFSIDDFGLWMADNHIKRMLRTFDRNPPEGSKITSAPLKARCRKR